MDSDMIGQVCQVYRVQNKKGDGPYRKGMTRSVLFRHWLSPEHPTPFGDIGICREPGKDELCGFESLEDLHGWVSQDEIEELSKLGFEIVVVRGLVTAVGAKQLLFEKMPEEDRGNFTCFKAMEEMVA